MKHATPDTIERLSPLLDDIRALGGLREKKPGVFYWKSRAFLHFHEDGDDLYADIRLDGADFERLPCSTPGEQIALVRGIRKWLRAH